MNVFWTLLRIQYKKCFVTLSKSLAGLLAALLLLTGGVAAVSYTVMQSQAFAQIKVAVSIPEGEKQTRQIAQFVSAMKSVQSICRFEYMDEENALEEMQSGEVQAAIVIPESFYDDIDSGVNTPATVYLPENPSLNIQIFAELVTNGVKMLQTGEAVTYANILEVKEYGAEYGSGKVANMIATCYMEAILSRGSLFEQEICSSTGEMDLYQFYFCSLALMLMLACSLNFAVLYYKRSNTIEQQLRVYGVGNAKQAFIRILVITSILWVIAMGICMITAVFSETQGNGFLILDGTGCAELALLCFSISGFIHLCYQYLPGNSHSVVWFLIISLIMILCSGILLPLSYLPKWIQPVGAVLPFNLWEDFMGRVLFTGCSTAHVIRLLVYTAVEFGIGALAIWKRS